MRWPQLWTRDLDGVLKWIQEVLANAAQSEPGLTGFIDEPLGGGLAPALPSGFAELWLGSTPPDGYLVLDGSLVFQGEAANLFEVVGFMFDPAPPAGMFRLPDLVAPVGTWVARR